VIEAEVLALCTPEGDRFLRDHLNESPDRLLLALHGRVDPFLLRAVAEQIRCRDKLAAKQPHFAKVGALAELSVLEQSTPREVALYRTTIMNGSSLCDCTGGMGVDTLALSDGFEWVTFCEIDPARAHLFAHNASLFGKTSIAVHCGDSMAFLRSCEKPFHWLFIDPARRNGEGKRFISLEESLPDVIGEARLLREKSHNMAIKISPAFDISMIYKQFEDCSRVVVISLHGEVREILVTVEQDVPVAPIRAVILGQGEPVEVIEDGGGVVAICAEEPRWLFEPDPAIIKAGVIDSLARMYALSRWSTSGVFLCGSESIPSFPGRQFKITKILPWQRKEIGRYLVQNRITAAAIIRRDFPLKPEEIRAQYKLAESSSQFLIFTADSRGSRVVINCVKWYK